MMNGECTRQVQFCDFTFASPAENLACDEALLDLCEEGHSPELLRFWESPRHFVVLGYATKASEEANLQACSELAIPVLRRSTGGGTVLQGPGCLNYSLVLSIEADGPCASIPGTNQFILKKHQVALSKLLEVPVEIQGQTDLSINGFKFSGNAQRRRRKFLLFHGTFLLALDFLLMEKVLPLPSRQPPYRANRSHGEFLVNLQLDSSLLKATMLECWQAEPQTAAPPLERIASLKIHKYDTELWNLKF